MILRKPPCAWVMIVRNDTALGLDTPYETAKDTEHTDPDPETPNP